MKGQSASEFMTVLPFAFVLFGLLVLAVFYQLAALSQTQERLEARTLAQQVAGTINSVYLGGEGSRQVYSFSSSNYTITIRNNSVEVISPHGEVAQALLFTNRTPSVQLNRTVVFRNQGDSIAID